MLQKDLLLEHMKVIDNVSLPLRLKGVSVQMDVMGRNFKNQFKFANRAGAAKTVIIGENELNEGMLQIKDMETGEQTSVPVGSIIDELTK